MSEELKLRKDAWTRALIVAWALVGIGLLAAAGGWLLGKVSGALVPFVLAVVIVLLLRRPVAALERRGMKRGLAVGLCYAIGFVVVGTALGFLVPALVDQMRQFIEAFPGYYGKASAIFVQLQDKYQSLITPPWLDQALANLQDTVVKQSAAWSASLAREVFSAGGSTLSFLTNSVLALVIGFWLLKDLPTISDEAVLLAGPRRREEASVISGKVSRILGGYLRGQLIISVVTMLVVGIGLSILGVPYSLVIGLLAGVFNVVPWIGPALTATIAGIAGAFVDGWHIVFAVLTVMAAQQITDIFVQPRVMSEHVDLHPVLVIFSLLAGATLFGFAGLVLAIPVAAVSKGLFVYFFEKYTDSTLATEEGALFRTRGSDDGSSVDHSHGAEPGTGSGATTDIEPPKQSKENE